MVAWFKINLMKIYYIYLFHIAFLRLSKILTKALSGTESIAKIHFVLELF